MTWPLKFLPDLHLTESFRPDGEEEVERLLPPLPPRVSSDACGTNDNALSNASLEHSHMMGDTRQITSTLCIAPCGGNNGNGSGTITSSSALSDSDDGDKGRPLIKGDEDGIDGNVSSFSRSQAS